MHFLIEDWLNVSCIFKVTLPIYVILCIYNLFEYNFAFQVRYNDPCYDHVLFFSLFQSILGPGFWQHCSLPNFKNIAHNTLSYLADVLCFINICILTSLYTVHTCSSRRSIACFNEGKLLKWLNYPFVIKIDLCPHLLLFFPFFFTFVLLIDPITSSIAVLKLNHWMITIYNSHQTMKLPSI